MIDLQSISTGLELGADGIWHAKENQNVSYPTDGNDNCFEIEDNSFWFNHRNNCIVSVVKAFPPKSNGTIFDIGGGNGFVSVGLANAGFDVALLEPGISGVLNAKKRGLKNLICATTDTAKLQQHSLSAVGLFDVIEHIEDDTGFLQQMRCLLKGDGYLYATVPAYSLLWSDEDVTAGHFRRYTMGSFSKVLNAAGFEVKYSSYIFQFLPAPIFLLRALPHKLGFSKSKSDDKSVDSDHVRKRGVMTNIMDSMLEREIKKLNKGKSLMFGGSCLVVAKCS